MNFISLKDSAIIFFEVILIIIIGIFLKLVDLHSTVNLIVFILLLFEIIWIIKFTYDKCSSQSKKIAIISFFILAICYVAMVTIKKIVAIPFTIATSYLFLMGYLFYNGCLIMSKWQIYKSKALIYKMVGIFVFVISITLGFFALFGLAK